MLVRSREAEASGVKDDVRRIEVELICKDGSTLWAEVIAKVMRDKSGKRIGYTGMTRDISDRKKAEQKLREGEDSLRALLDATADNVGLFSLDGTILTVNQNMADAMGHTIKEMLGQNIFRYFPRKMAKERKASFDMAVESKVPQFMKDVRSGRIIDSAIYPLLGESGEVTTLAVYAKDVTDAILAEQAQKQSEKQYRRIVETVNEGIIGFDADQRITYANQITADFLGYEIEEIVGSSYYDVLLPEDLDDHKKRVERQSRGKRERYERCFLRKDGEIVWGLVSATPILAEDGRHLGSFAMIADITETKKSEKLIRKSEERYRRIIETANEGVLQIGTDSVVQFVNKRMCDMLGYTTIELHGSVVAKLLFPEDVGALTELLERREQWLSGHYEQRLRHKDGHEVWTQVSASAIFGDEIGRAHV